MPNFTDILNAPADSIKPPQPLPVGEYEAVIDGQPQPATLGEKQTPAMLFKVKLLRAVNVDEAELREALDGRPLGDITLNLTMWATQASAYRFKTFLKDHLGLTFASLAEGCAKAPGRELLVTLGHRSRRDSGELVSDIIATARLPNTMAA